MLITNKFVMLNFPKTGSTFARRALNQVHQPGRIRRILEDYKVLAPAVEEQLMMPYFFTEIHRQATGDASSQHGVYSQIPAAHKNKVVATVIRDPFKRLVSLYEFRSWAKHPIPDSVQVKKWFPNFPDLSFNEHFSYTQEHTLPYVLPEGMQVEVGSLTAQFIRFYAHDPLKTMLALREDTDLRRDYDLHFPKIHFLHTENLNQDLHDFLLELGYPATRIAFILSKKKVNTTTRSKPSYFTQELFDEFQRKERFFFQLFPEYLRADPQALGKFY